MVSNEKRLILNEKGEVHMIVKSGNYETEINGKIGMYKFSAMIKLELKNGLKIAPYTELTEELQNVIATNLKVPLNIYLGRFFKNKKGETVWEEYDGPDAEEIFLNLLELTPEDFVKDQTE